MISKQMSALLIVLMLTLLSAKTVKAAGDAVDATKAVKPDGDVDIRVVRGEVDIIGWDQPEVRVVGTLDEATKAFIFEVDGDETRIFVRLEENRRGSFMDSKGARLKIYLPASGHTEFSGVSTDLEVEGLNGSVELGVVSGDVKLTGGLNRIEVQSVSGDIEIRDVSGRIIASTISGDLEVYNAAGEANYTSVSGDIQVYDGAELMELESVSGDIEVFSKLVRSATGHSVSGDIEFTADLAPGSDIEFNSISGSIVLALGGARDARVRLDTASGSISNGLSDHRPIEPRYGNGQELKFTLGEGEGQIRMSSRSGDLVLDSN